MSKLHKILAGIFCMGVLLCGLGTGVAFTEFSELNYGEKYFLGETEMKTEYFDVEYEPEENQQHILYWNSRGSVKMQADESVPENTVRFVVTYNARRVEPKAYWNREQGEIVLHYNWKGQDDEVALMMEAKDLVLDNLKKRKIVSFDVREVEEITVLVNPASERDVLLQ